MSISYKATPVLNVSKLFSIKAKHDDVFQTLGYTTKGVGSNLYRYDATSSATPDGGFTLPGIGGTLSFSGTTFNGTAGTGRFIAVDHTVADVTKFGALGDGVTDAWGSIQRCVNTAFANETGVMLPAGSFAISAAIDNDGSCSFRGAGIGKTYLITTSASAGIVYDASTGPGETILHVGGFTIDLDGIGTIGLDIGGAAGSAISKTSFSHIRILSATQYGMRIRSSISNTYTDVVCEDCTGTAAGLYIDNENNVTEQLFVNCSFRQNHYGVKLHSGNHVQFLNCIIEANRHAGVWSYRSSTNGFDNSLFTNCWLEANGYNPSTLSAEFTATADSGTDRLDAAGSSFALNYRVWFRTTGTAPGGLSDDASYWVVFASATEVKLSHTFGGAVIDITDAGTGTHSLTRIDTDVASVYSEMSGGIAADRPASITFDNCVITGGLPAFDVMIDRGNNLLFNRCSFSNPDVGGFTGRRFGISSPTTSFARLIDCNALNSIPSPSLYAGMPALVGTRGFLYEYWYQNALHSNSIQRILTSTGSPEGNIAANVGAICVRTDGGTSTTLYIKESGTGNTGWVPK